MRAALLTAADPVALLQLAQARLQSGQGAAAQVLVRRAQAAWAARGAPGAAPAPPPGFDTERLIVEGLIASGQPDAANR